MNKGKKIVSIILSFLIFIGEAVVITIFALKDGWDTFRFFTNDANIVLGLGSLVFGIAQIVSLAKGKKVGKLPLAIKLMGVTAGLLTLLTVYCYLIPVVGNPIVEFALEPTYFLWVHTVIPAVGVLSFILFDFDDKKSLGILDSFEGLIPVVIYAAAIITLIVLNKIEAPYPFLEVTTQKWWVSVLWLGGMLVGTFVIALILILLAKLIAKKPVEEVAAPVAEEKPVEEEKPVAAEKEEKAVVVTPVEEKKEEVKPVPEKKEEPVQKVAEKEPVQKKEPVKAEPKKEEKPASKKEKKPAPKKEAAKPAPIKKEEKPVEKKAAPTKAEPAKKAAAPAKKPEAAKPAEAPAASYQEGPRVYHIAKNPNGQWQVKLASGQKAIKLFPTQAEAIVYAKELVKTQGGSIRIHSMKGHLRKE